MTGHRVRTTLRLDEGLNQELDGLAASLGVARTMVIVELLRRGLENVDEETLRAVIVGADHHEAFALAG